MPDKMINQDGKSYRFTPGKGGSLTALSPKNAQDPFASSQVSKVVPMLREMRKKRTARINTASARG